MSACMTNPVLVDPATLDGMLGVSTATGKVHLSQETRDLVHLLMAAAATGADLDDDLVDDGHAVQRLRSGADGENPMRRHGNRHRGEPGARPAIAQLAVCVIAPAQDLAATGECQ